MELYLGRVIENKFYSETGFIEVLIAQKLGKMGGEKEYSGEFNLKDLTEGGNLRPDYSNGMKANGMTKQCRILSPLGSGHDYGMFCMPQVNSLGFVATIDNVADWDSKSSYVWLGGAYGGKMYGKELTLPSETENINLNYEDEPYISTKTINKNSGEDTISSSPYINEGMFLVKLKSTKTKDTKADSEDIAEKHVHYNENPSFGTFMMKSSKVNLRHNSYNEKDTRIGVSDLTFEKNKIQLVRLNNSSGNDNERIEQIQLFDDEKVQLQFLDKNKKLNRTLTMDEEGIEIKFDNENKNKKVTLTLDKTGNLIVEADTDCDINVKGDVNVKNKAGCELHLKDKISIKNRWGDLYTLLKNLYNNLLSLQTIGILGPSFGTAWAAKFVPKDLATLELLMEKGEMDFDTKSSGAIT